MSKKVNIATIQLQCNQSVEENMQKVTLEVQKAAKEGAQIICLQELFKSQYFCFEENEKHFSLAETIPGPSTELFSALSKELGVVIIASLFEKSSEEAFYNTTIVTDADGSYLGKYRKTHIPYDPGYYEKYYFSAGKEDYKVFDTQFAKIGVLICWDQWYPEAARLMALKGAEILFYPTAIGWDLDASDEVKIEEFNAWQTIQKSHAIANGVHVVAVNRTGIENGLVFWGGSFISNPFGTLLYEAPHDKEVSHVQTVDLSTAKGYRTVWPFLKERRSDLFDDLTKKNH